VKLVRRIPVAARWCMLIAFVNAVVWAFVTPPFQVPDETGHVVYVQYLAETGDVPDKPGKGVFSDEESALVVALRFNDVVGQKRDRAIGTEVDDAAVRAVGEDRPNPVGEGGSIESSPQPPLFYAAESLIYLASPWQDLLDRLLLMRLFAALLAAVTTGFTYLFLRELLREPWTWTVGALVVAFQPLFGFISSGVTPDSLLFAATAALLFGLARAFRRGLSPGLGAFVGATLAVGVLSKLNFVAIVPGALLGLALLCWRAPAERRAVALRGAGAAVAILAACAALTVVLNKAVFDRPAWGGGVEAAASVATGDAPVGARVPGVAERVSYTWQLYLPRLPFMSDQFDYFPLRSTFFNGTIGTFGWLDTTFANWVYDVALVLALALLALLVVELVRRRAVLWRRLPEAITYAAMVAGLLASIGVLGLRYRLDTGFAFEQARYLLPFLPLYAAGVVLAARGVGRRFELPLATVLVVLAMAHGLFAQLLVVSRFYG
jgi:4-amino-4-deoxy-L-arabinose transferase-like glycosyltransferase